MNYLGLFLQTAPFGTFVASIMIFLAIVFLFAAVIYVYSSFAFMKIGKRAGLSYSGVAWIPVFGPFVIPFRISKMHWWPWLLLISMVVGVFLEVSEITIGSIVLIVSALVFAIYSIIWDWKMFQTVGRPGWWALTYVVPPIYLVLIGVAAWGKKENPNTSMNQQHLEHSRHLDPHSRRYQNY